MPSGRILSEQATRPSQRSDRQPQLAPASVRQVVGLLIAIWQGARPGRAGTSNRPIADTRVSELLTPSVRRHLAVWNLVHLPMTRGLTTSSSASPTERDGGAREVSTELWPVPPAPASKPTRSRESARPAARSTPAGVSRPWSATRGHSSCVLRRPEGSIRVVRSERRSPADRAS
jgi:hypothetical protein